MSGRFWAVVPKDYVEGDGNPTMASKATFELYEDHAGEWRWRLVHDNGNIIADGGQGYASKRRALDGIESVKNNAAEAPIEEHRIEELDDPP